MPKTTVQELADSAMQDPLFMLEYFKQHKGTLHSISALKSLFNHAGKAVPRDLQEAKSPTCEIPRKDMAALIYRAARNYGESIASAAARWIRMRIG